MKLSSRGFESLVFAAMLTLAAVSPTSADIQDFGGYPAGTRVATDEGGLPLWPDFTITKVVNNNGPDVAIIFDSLRPTGGDWDLGSPNVDFGGLGMGAGGGSGQPGENSRPLGNLIIIAENVADANGNGLVDDPDDDDDGGCITIEFDPGVIPLAITLIDVDEETAVIAVEADGVVVTVDATLPGDNAVKTLDLQGLGTGLRRVEVCFSHSGGIAEIEYSPGTTSLTEGTWGAVKGRYRE